MTLTEMIMPKMGESITEGTIISWLKKVGDPIASEEAVLEVATDKVDTEIPATHGGVLKEILAQEGETVEVGKPIAIIATEVKNAPEQGAPSPQTSFEEESLNKTIATHQATPASTSALEKPASDRFYSPLVLNICRQENIPMAELEALPGTGKAGRVTKKDILAYVKSDRVQNVTTPPAAAHTPIVTPDVSCEDEIIEMDRMRKMIAERMVASKQISPHVTSFVEADVSEIVHWRRKYKKAFMEKSKQALTFTPLFIEAVVHALKDYPMVNVQVDGHKIIKKGAIHIGMAVALPTGNLIVPVIRNADQLSLKGITLKVNDLARRARENQLTPEDLSGGTYTVSNVGSFGNVMGTPIIMQPQVGILALGAIVKKPSVIETPKGDLIGIRHKMFLSHSYDHRVVDGALGGMFVRRVADYLENFDASRSV